MIKVSVLVCLTNFHPAVGGLERYVEELYSRLADEGWDVHIVCYDNSNPRRETYRGLTIHRIRRRLSVGGVFAVPVLSEWRRFLREVATPGRFDLVATQTRFFFSSFLGVLLATRQGIPCLHTEHGGDFVAHASAAVRWGARFYDLTLGRWVLRHADEITGVSEEVASFVGRLSGRPCAVVHNGIDTKFWDPAQAAPLPSELLSWIGPRRGVLFMGRLLESKGWRVLLQALADPALSEVPLAVMLAGDGPDRVAVERAVADSGLAARVRYLGPLKPEAIRDLLAVCAYCNPSYSGEGLQTTLLEAAAMGAPIVSTSVSGAAEVVGTDTGILVPKRNVPALAGALRELAEQPARMQGRQRVAQAFSWERITQTYGALASRLLERR